MDTQRLKERTDLRHIVARDLGEAPLRSGRAWLWKCPFHRERKGHSFAVWADGYRCFGQCDTNGDVFDWLREYRQMSFTEALAFLGESPTDAPVEPKRAQDVTGEPPSSKWQAAAQDVVNYAEETLWSGDGEGALQYLIGRGLTTRTIREARLGYISGDHRAWLTLYGLEVPCGITIPLFSHGALWSVKVRRGGMGLVKYIQVAGGSPYGLYGADDLPQHENAVFCEGEFDALIVKQAAGSLVAAVTLGSSGTRLAARWFAELIHCKRLFAAYDNDEAGTRGAKRLMTLSPRFEKLNIPQGKDITEFYLGGGDVYGWIEGAIRTIGDTPHVR